MCIKTRIKLKENSGSGFAKYSLKRQVIINKSKSPKFSGCAEFVMVALSIPAIQLDINMATAKMAIHSHPGKDAVP